MRSCGQVTDDRMRAVLKIKKTEAVTISEVKKDASEF